MQAKLQTRFLGESMERFDAAIAESPKLMWQYAVTCLRKEMVLALLFATVVLAHHAGGSSEMQNDSESE
jgi:hypothetical protein